MAWYYLSDHKRFGPISADELRSRIAQGIVRPTDLLKCKRVHWESVESVIDIIKDSTESAEDDILLEGCSSEGDVAKIIGTLIIYLSIISAAICIFAFGKIEIQDSLYSTRTVWSPTLIGIFVAGGINGAFFGYLLSKVGSVLKHLEAIRVRT